MWRATGGEAVKEIGNWIAVIGIVALCAVCWLVLLVVMPFVPDLDVKAGCKHL
jgi:hypothetical protein